MRNPAKKAAMRATKSGSGTASSSPTGAGPAAPGRRPKTTTTEKTTTTTTTRTNPRRAVPRPRKNPGGLSAYREPYPGGRWADWVRALRGKSGVYVIRSGPGAGRVHYVGESHSGKLRDTLQRHFQRWKGETAGPTYDATRVQVAVEVCDPKSAIERQNQLISELDPADNQLIDGAIFSRRRRVNPEGAVMAKRAKKSSKRTARKNPAKKSTRRRRRRNPSPTVVAVNPAPRKRRRRSHKRRSNPSTRRRSSPRRRKNPGALSALGTLGLAALGAGVGLIGSKLLDRATLTPMQRGGAKIAAGLVTGFGAGLLSPGLGAGLFGGLGVAGASDVYDGMTLTAPKPSQDQTMQLTQAQANLDEANQMGVTSRQSLRAVEARMGAVSPRFPR